MAFFEIHEAVSILVIVSLKFLAFSRIETVIIYLDVHFSILLCVQWWVPPPPRMVTGLDREGEEVLHWPQHPDDPLEPPPGEREPSHGLGEDREQGVWGLLCQVSI